ncbi:MAG: ABC transporter permease [Pseudomonadota bacterium]
MSNKIHKMADGIDETLFTMAEYDARTAELGGYSNYSYWRSTWQVFLKNRAAFALMIVIAVLVLFTIVQPLLPYQKLPTQIYTDPATNMQLRNTPPSMEHWFGTNSIGQDLWARIWSGTRTSLFIGVMVGMITAGIGIIVGSIWGYVRGLERFFTEIYNIFDNIPTTVILVLMTYIMRPSLFTLIFAMCITGWLSISLLIRNLIVIIRDREYNLASRCLGTPTSRVITKNLLPYLVSVIMLRIALAIPIAIGSEVFLTYIGLGLPVEIPSLGNLINEGRLVMMSESLRYQLFFPAIVISIITISFYVMGNAFGDAADPRNHV